MATDAEMRAQLAQLQAALASMAGQRAPEPEPGLLTADEMANLRSMSRAEFWALHRRLLDAEQTNPVKAVAVKPPRGR